jgi:sortase A
MSRAATPAGIHDEQFPEVSSGGSVGALDVRPRRRRPIRRAAATVMSVAVLTVVGAGCMPKAPPSTQLAYQLIEEAKSGGTTPTWFSSADMGRSLPIYQGATQSVVDRGGAAWELTSARLGQPGNTVLFAHRVSHGGPFRTIAQLHNGSLIRLGGADGRTYTYAVVRSQVTAPTWAAVLNFHDGNKNGLILVACHPLGSTALRYVVDAELVGVS